MSKYVIGKEHGLYFLLQNLLIQGMWILLWLQILQPLQKTVTAWQNAHIVLDTLSTGKMIVLLKKGFEHDKRVQLYIVCILSN